MDMHNSYSYHHSDSCISTAKLNSVISECGEYLCHKTPLFHIQKMSRDAQKVKAELKETVPRESQYLWVFLWFAERGVLWFGEGSECFMILQSKLLNFYP